MPSFPLFSGGAGVTSVGLSAPSIFAVSGSPVTSTGTLTLSLNTQPKNSVFAGPGFGADAIPTFRALLAADLPDLSSVYQSLNAGLTSISALSTTSFGLGFLTQANSAAARTYIGAGTGSGSVTSVALTLPSFLSVTGSPITGAGTLAVSLANQSANLVFAGPTTGSAAAPTFRALVAADIPDVSGTYLTKANNLSDVASVGTSRTNLGLGSLAVLNSVNNGNWSGAALAIGNGGTGQTTATAAFNALSPLTTLGDIIYGGAVGAGTRLAGNTTAAKLFLSQTGTGAVSAAPGWAALASADIPWATPGAIGSTTPNTGSFTQLKLDLGTGSVPVSFPAFSNYDLWCLTTDATTARALLASFGGANSITGLSYGGTRASPTATPSDTRALVMQANAFDGTTVYTPASMDVRTDGLQSGTNHGGYLEWTGTPNGSTTAAEWMRLQNNNLVIDRQAGTAIPTIFSAITSGYTFQVQSSDTVASRIGLFAYAALGNSIKGFVAGGTRATPTAVADQTILFRFSGGAYDGSAVTEVGQFTVLADGLQSGTNHGGYFAWAGIPNGSTTIAEWLRLQNGWLKILPVTAPSGNPSSGFYFYCDAADNKLKARGVSGTVTTVANP